MNADQQVSVPVLDHGYVRLVESWGSDERIIEAARMSTGKGFLGWGWRTGDGPCRDCDGIGLLDDRGFPLRGQPYFDTQTCPTCKGDKLERLPGDEKLLRYLWEHRHATPFEMAGMVIEVQAPIFVFREWHRHRTQSYNELSARYTPLPDVNYVPTVERLLRDAGGSNRQAGRATGAAALTEPAASAFQSALLEQYDAAEALYQKALADGVPKELARCILPVGRYSRMRASANLRNWLAFLTLRMAPDAQWEIRKYANAVGELIAQAFPRTWALAKIEHSP